MGGTGGVGLRWAGGSGRHYGGPAVARDPGAGPVDADAAGPWRAPGRVPRATLPVSGGRVPARGALGAAPSRHRGRPRRESVAPGRQVADRPVTPPGNVASDATRRSPAMAETRPRAWSSAPDTTAGGPTGLGPARRPSARAGATPARRPSAPRAARTRCRSSAWKRLLVRVQPLGDLGVAVLLDGRPVAVGDRDQHVPVRPALPVEPRRPHLDVRVPTRGQLLAQDRPVVAPEQVDELVVGAPPGPVEVGISIGSVIASLSCRACWPSSRASRAAPRAAAPTPARRAAPPCAGCRSTRRIVNRPSQPRVGQEHLARPR